MLADAKNGAEPLIGWRGPLFRTLCFLFFNKISYNHIFTFFLENTRPRSERLCCFEHRVVANGADKSAVFGQSKLAEQRHALSSY